VPIPSSATFLSPISLRRYFWTLPLAVIGKESTKKMYLGILKRLIFPRQKSRMSSSLTVASGCRITKAPTSSLLSDDDYQQPLLFEF